MKSERLAVTAWIISSLAIATVPSLATGQEVVQATNLESVGPPRSRPPQNSQPQSHPLDPAIRIAQAALENVRSNVHDYTALFVKRCRVDGQLKPLEFVKLKVLSRKTNDGAIVTPRSLYLGFENPPAVKGREVIWVEGQNDGDMLVHDGGLASLLTLNLDPNGFLAMRGQRYPVTKVGIEPLLEEILMTLEHDRQYGESEVQFYRNARIGDESCTMIEVVHPVPRDHFRFHRARVYFSDRLNLPIRFESYLWPEGENPGELDEEYNYLNLEVNVGLTARDFDVSNPEYKFR